METYNNFNDVPMPSVNETIIFKIEGKKTVFVKDENGKIIISPKVYKDVATRKEERLEQKSVEAKEKLANQLKELGVINN